MLATKIETRENKFQTALKYLGEYRGVQGAVIFDNDGLVISHIGGDDFDAETFSSLALLMLELTNNVLNRLDENPVQTMMVKTKDCWITCIRSDDLILVVKADKGTDELLKVRIGQAVDMINLHFRDNYPLLIK